MFIWTASASGTMDDDTSGKCDFDLRQLPVGNHKVSLIAEPQPNRFHSPGEILNPITHNVDISPRFDVKFKKAQDEYVVDSEHPNSTIPLTIKKRNDCVANNLRVYLANKWVGDYPATIKCLNLAIGALPDGETAVEFVPLDEAGWEYPTEEVTIKIKNQNWPNIGDHPQRYQKLKEKNNLIKTAELDMVQAIHAAQNLSVGAAKIQLEDVIKRFGDKNYEGVSLAALQQTVKLSRDAAAQFGIAARCQMRMAQLNVECGALYYGMEMPRQAKFHFKRALDIATEKEDAGRQAKRALDILSNERKKRVAPPAHENAAKTGDDGC